MEEQHLSKECQQFDCDTDVGVCGYAKKHVLRFITCMCNFYELNKQLMLFYETF